MKQRFFTLGFLLTLFLSAAQNLKAQEKQFDVTSKAVYVVDEKGQTTVTQNISITNNTEYYFTPNYSVKVGVSDVKNIRAYNSDGSIPTTLDTSDPKNTAVKLAFTERYAGLDTVNEFTLEFTTNELARKKGVIWEITIPGVADIGEFESYDLSIRYPNSFGNASIIKPTSTNKSLSFSKAEIGQSGIYIVFGDKQYYKYELSYNISNPNLFPVKTEIAIPPSTNYQNSTITSFSENPLNVSSDKDGNWIAEYRLLPQEKKTIKVEGVIEVLAVPKSENIDNSKKELYTKSVKYWDTDNPNVEKAAKGLLTPKEIYDFVVKSLSYNRDKVSTDGIRIGGKGALDDPENSVCLEFTDLFISLARAKGIPARAVEGFAYTDNSQTRPLSLVSDILHAWPEYYDIERKTWVMVDPTWGKTTSGMDYFTTLDLSHVAFAVKGQDSEYPIPAGGYKFSKDSKDVNISFANANEFEVVEELVVSENFSDKLLPKFNAKGTVTVKNSGNSPLKNLDVVISTSEGTVRNFNISYLPPFGHKEITTSFSDTPVLTNEDYVITIQVGEKIHKKNIAISFVPDTKTILVIGGIIGVSTITAAVTFHTGSLLVQRRKRKNSIRR